jgi:WhiB family redox-sensing transcriptional regulator
MENRMNTSWGRYAPCAQIGGDIWFPEDGDNGIEAKKICTTCPYRQPCLTDAIRRGETHGIWGGVAAHRFRHLRAQLDDGGPLRLASAPTMRRALHESFADKADAA